MSTNAGDSSSPFLTEWGFTLKDLYGLSVTFFKEKDGKAVHFSYEERLKLMALSLQVVHGKFDPETARPVGAFDVIGKDRRLAWQNLGEKSKADCMFEFITTLNKQCSSFRPFVEAHKRDLEMKQLKEAENSWNQEKENNEEYEQLERQLEEEKQRTELQKRRIQDALNLQTFHQFKSYAEQQFPGNPEQQAILIRQLQEQHYEQYMRQIYQQQQLVTITDQSNNKNKSSNVVEDGESNGSINHANHSDEDENEGESKNEKRKHGSDRDHDPSYEEEAGKSERRQSKGEEDNENDEDSSTQLAAASMWTRKDIKEFKDSVRAEGGEAIIRIGQGESVTVRVPTHDDGTCLFWEFATDSYDIGFGLFFEWTTADEPVSVHVTEENSTEDEEDEDDETFQQLQRDVEKGRELLPKGAKQNTDVIIPVYRRDAHAEVYVGSHLFPGKGVYLLKFDNSYSFWRSKTLYYRVYYTK